MILFALFGFTPNEADVIKRDDYLRYFYMTVGEQERQFNKHSLDEQYNLFLYGNQVMHPPASYLSKTFAEQGPQIIPFLRKKLEATQSELTIRDIAAVLVKFQRMKTYDFSKDPDLVALLDRKINGMSGPWKSTTLKMLVELRSQ